MTLSLIAASMKPTNLWWTGMPWGILIGGVGQSQWGQALGQRTLEIAHDEP